MQSFELVILRPRVRTLGKQTRCCAPAHFTQTTNAETLIMWKLMTPIGATALSTPATCCLAHSNSRSNLDRGFRSFLGCRRSLHGRASVNSVNHHKCRAFSVTRQHCLSILVVSTNRCGAAGKRGHYGGVGGAGGTAYATHTGYGESSGAAGIPSAPTWSCMLM